MQFSELVVKFEELINGAQKILITSHISPDPDAVASLILMGTTLESNFPDKQVSMVLEEKPIGLDFLPGYQKIVFKPFLEALKELAPEILIVLDGNNYERVSRADGEQVRHLVSERMLKTAIIDHHEHDGKDNTDVYINSDYPATVQDVYKVLFGQMSLRKPDDFAFITMVGLYADTGGFVYLKEGQQDEAFDLAKELVDSGANTEQIKNHLSQFTEDDMRALSELAKNVTHQDDYTYSFISDVFIADWQSRGKGHSDLQRSTGTFLDEYIRNIDGRKWGFISYKNLLEDGKYNVSLRATGDTKDVSAIASALGGGGHKPAAGGRFEASNIEEALEKVKSTIREVNN